jgi:hypothetical protein
MAGTPVPGSKAQFFFNARTASMSEITNDDGGSRRFTQLHVDYADTLAPVVGMFVVPAYRTIGSRSGKLRFPPGTRLTS